MIIRTRRCKAARTPRAPHAQLGWLMQDTVEGNPLWMGSRTDLWASVSLTSRQIYVLKSS